MLSIIIGVVFFGAMILQVILSFRLRSMANKLSDKNIQIRKWSSYAATKDLKNVLNTTLDTDTKKLVVKILVGIKQRNQLFFGSMGVIILIFILNGIFK